MTKPAKLKLTIYQGATFRKRLTWRAPSKAPIDLTGCTARMQAAHCKQSYESELQRRQLPNHYQRARSGAS